MNDPAHRRVRSGHCIPLAIIDQGVNVEQWEERALESA